MLELGHPVGAGPAGRRAHADGMHGAAPELGGRAGATSRRDDQAADWSLGSSKWRSAAIGLGALNKYPCTCSHPSLYNSASCSSVSTPSAITLMPSDFPRASTARTMARQSLLSLRLRTKLWSILILSNGKRRR